MRDQREGDAFDQRRVARDGERLRVHREQAEAQTEREEGELLDDAPPQVSRVAQAAQRPVVEQEQDEGERDGHGLREQGGREQPERERVVPPGPSAGPCGPAPQRGEREARGQQLLALRDPGDRLDQCRVHGEERRHGQARQRRLGQGAKRGKEQDRVQRVEQYVDHVVCAGSAAEQLHVEHVREQRERVVVVDVKVAEGPRYAFEREPSLHHRILRDVQRVVVRQVLELPHAGPGQRDQQREPCGRQCEDRGRTHG